jgi:trimeric autotransporter adhesin
MNPEVISRRTTSARILVTGAAAALALGTALAAGAGAAATPRGARAAPAPGTITTVAGGVGGPGQATTVALAPCGVSFQNGSIYVADGGTVRKISPAGQLTTPAGIGVGGPRSTGGLATEAALVTCGTAVDHAGNLVMADPGRHQVTVVAAKTGTFYGQAMTAGHLYAVAGTGKFGYAPSGVPAATAKFGGAQDVTVDGAGNLVIADWGHNLQDLTRWARVQVVAAKTGTFYGQAMTAGDIYTVAGSGLLRGANANGHPATQAAIGEYLGQVTVDQAGNVLVASPPLNRVWLVAGTSGRFYGQAMTAGDIYTIVGTGGRKGSTGDGGPATQASIGAQGVAVDAAGNAVITDFGNTSARIRVVAAKTGTFYGQAMTTGDIYTIAGNGTRGFAGDGGPATAAQINTPQAVAVDAATGDVAIADMGSNFFGPNGGLVRVVAGSTGTRYGQAMTAGDIYTVGGVLSNGNAETFSGDGGPATRAELSPRGVSLDHAGNQVIADQGDDLIRVVAAATGTFYGQAMTAGDIYTVAGNGTLGFSGDGSPATKAALGGPEDVAVDHAGNLVIADGLNYRVRVVAGTTGTFYGQAMTAGHIYTVAGDGDLNASGDGGPATSAGMNPTAISVDSAGNLVIADDVNSLVRVAAVTTGTFYGRAMTKGDIYTVAGNGQQGFSGDGGPATSAELDNPGSVAIDGHGNLLISDSTRIRLVAG